MDTKVEMIENNSTGPKLHNYHILVRKQDLAIDGKVDGRTG